MISVVSATAGGDETVSVSVWTQLSESVTVTV